MKSSNLLRGIEMLESWFRHSFIYVFITQYINHSVVARAFEWIGKVIVDSKVASILRAFAMRPYYPDGSFIYRLLEKLNRKSALFRDRMALYLKESFIYRLLSDSKAYRLITMLFVPMAALYAFIDEFGRKVFGNSSWFGLWDEAFLLASILYVFLTWFFNQREPLKITPVGAPMVLLISVTFCLFLINSTYPKLGLDGLRVIVQYVLWFFIMNSFITDDDKAYLVLRFLVYGGGVMGLHGILQFIMKVPTPSHWTDAAEGNTTTRVFSIVESPNILGSIFILMIPLCFAMVLQRKLGKWERLILFGLFGAMGISLILTQSRGAWLGAAIAAFVFCISINPRWLFILGIGGSGLLLVPPVMNRISYLLSPQYIISSMTGGRLMRYQKGMEIFRQNKLLGVGLGHFGGAVAMNNKDLIPDTFYMDNYWLKTAVEMGLVGLLAFGLLVLILVIWSIRSVKQCKDFDTKLIAAAGFAGMCGVLTHNLIENVFEVPYMVVYFWIIASIVLYFGLRRKSHIPGTHVDNKVH